ncbi:unnamed protein product, partial [Amoebophrya sp. A120]
YFSATGHVAAFAEFCLNGEAEAAVAHEDAQKDHNTSPPPRPEDTTATNRAALLQRAWARHQSLRDNFRPPTTAGVLSGTNSSTRKQLEKA